MVSWVFVMLERISASCEDPFEWCGTDVPIATLCRVIEIDLREMLDEDDIPKPLRPVEGMLL